jgi:hypothetical protein
MLFESSAEQIGSLVDFLKSLHQVDMKEMGVKYW